MPTIVAATINGSLTSSIDSLSIVTATYIRLTRGGFTLSIDGCQLVLTAMLFIVLYVYLSMKFV
jgi:hypothetical protein